jgi:nitroreductase
MDTPSLSSSSDMAQGFACLVRQRRATRAFAPDLVPPEVIEQAFALAAQAPSGYNLQPWRFLLLTEPAQKARLRRAAFDQDKITQAPLMIVAFGQREGWKENADEIFHLACQRRGLDLAAEEKQKRGALAFVSKLSPAVWLNRQVMIAFTHLMLAFEALGWDTAPMEGFDAAAVVKAFELPADAEVVALLAVGRAREAEPPHPGRLDIDRIAFRERFGTPFQTHQLHEAHHEH